MKLSLSTAELEYIAHELARHEQLIIELRNEVRKHRHYVALTDAPTAEEPPADLDANRGEVARIMEEIGPAPGYTGGQAGIRWHRKMYDAIARRFTTTQPATPRWKA